MRIKAEENFPRSGSTEMKRIFRGSGGRLDRTVPALRGGEDIEAAFRADMKRRSSIFNYSRHGLRADL